MRSQSQTLTGTFILGTFVPRNEISRVGTFVLGNESSIELPYPGTKIPCNFRSHDIRPMIKFRSCATENVHVIVCDGKKFRIHITVCHNVYYVLWPNEKQSI